MKWKNVKKQENENKRTQIPHKSYVHGTVNITWKYYKKYFNLDYHKIILIL